MIDDAIVYRMARWLYDRDTLSYERDDEWIPTEAYRNEAMHALQCALQESLGPAVTIRRGAQ